MKEVLVANGWKMYHECNNCSGHRQFYNNKEKPDFEVRIKVKNQTFSILYKNQIIAGPCWGYQMQEKLNQYVA